MKGSDQHAGGGKDGEIWFERNTEEDLLDVNDSSIFYDDFLPLPHFPCMSSSSSSSSTPAPPKPIASSAPSSSSSASSAASWALLKSDAEDDHHDQTVAPPSLPPPPPTTNENIDCMDVMETFGYMELIDSNEIWDPSSIFQTDNPPDVQHDDQSLPQQQQQQHYQNNENNNFLLQGNDVVPENKPPSDELGTMFFEWLKSNKDYISAADMRNIKLRRATVESASKRLGGTEEGRKQLLKLILEWVEQYQLQKKRLGEAAAAAEPIFPYQEPFQNPNPNPSCNSIPPVDINPSFVPSPWIPSPLPQQPQYVTDPTAFPFGGDLYSGGGPSNYRQPPEYHMLETAQTWPPIGTGPAQYQLAAPYNQFPETNNSVVVTAIPNQQGFGGYGNQYPYHQQYNYQANNNGEKLVRLGSSATREARKKRMARQRRFIAHHRHHSNNHEHQYLQHQITQNVDHQQQVNIGGESCSAAGQANPAANWVYWPNAAAPAATGPSTVPVVAAEAPQPQVAADRPTVEAQNCQQRQVPTEKRQGLKSEKNLKFLLQKVLKQSDVGNLGRIVLPKKEAETHLPELEARDGIAIAMEDIGTSQVWNMRYRFWPNNKSRMYLLENTGDFIRANGLQEGDFIVIYSDVKCGKYMIRGVKVRQPGTKPESKKPTKGHRNSRMAARVNGSGSSSQPSQRE